MADPLSSTASVLTVLDATTRLLEIFKRIKQRGDVITQLNNEVTDLKLVLKRLQQGDTQCNLDQSIQEILKTAKVTLDEAEKALKYTPPSIVKRYKQRLDLSSLSRLERTLRNVKHRLGMAFEAELISSVQRIEVDVKSIRLDNITRREPPTQKGLASQSDAVLQTELERSLPSIQTLDTGNSMSGPSTLAQPSPEEVSTWERTILTLKTTYREENICPTSCSCICHRRNYYFSNKFLGRMCGIISIGYVGLPVMTPKCNSSECGRQTATEIELAYYFPGWFLARIGWALRINSTAPEFLTLRILNLVPRNASFFHASAHGDLESIKSMFRSNIASVRDIGHEDGRSALHSAVNMGEWTTCELLLNAGADPDLRDFDGVSPRSVARERYLNPVYNNVRTILDRLFPDYDGSCLEHFDFTVIHKVLLGLNIGDLETEINRSRHLIDVTDTQGNTALLWAIKSVNVNAANILLDHFADPNICDKADRSPLHYVGRCTDIKLLRRILKLTKDPKMKTIWGGNALHWMCAQGPDDLTYPQILIDGGIEVDEKNGYQDRSALFQAAQYDKANVACYLLDRGADINAESTEGETPLMEAIYGDSHKCIELFFEKCARYTGRNKRGNTILHIAASAGNITTLECLTRANLRGIDTQSKNVDHKTAEMIARNRVWEKVIHRDLFLTKFHELISNIDGNSGSIFDTEIDTSDTSDTWMDALEFL